MADTLRIIARLTARPGMEADLRAVLRGLIAPTRQEPGCISYELLENRIDPAEFTFVEEWRDEAALEEHFGTAHIKDALAKSADLLAEEMDLRQYDLVD